MRKIGIILAVLAWATSGLASPPLTPEQMCAIIRQDVAEYLATGHPCACPYNRMRNGGQCGNRSAWAKPSGKAPKCYFEDVTGELGPNLRLSPTRQIWPPPPPCAG